MRRHSKSLIALLILIVFLSPFAAVISRLVADTGVFDELWAAFVRELPFGSVIAKGAVSLLSETAPVLVNSQKYLSAAKELHTVLEFFQELGKLLLTATIYGLLSKVAVSYLELGERGGIAAFFLKVLANMISVFLAALLVTPLLHYAYREINRLSGAGSGFWTAVILAITVIGASGIYALLLSLGAGLAIGYVLVKLVLMNIVQLLAAGFCLAFALLNLAEGTWHLALLGFGSWTVILIILVGIDLMLESVFG